MYKFSAVALLGVFSFYGCSSFSKPQAMQAVASGKTTSYSDRAIASDGKSLIGQGGVDCDKISNLYKTYANNNCSFDKVFEEFGKPISEQVCFPLELKTTKNAEFAFGYIAAVRDSIHLSDSVYRKLALKMAQLSNQNPDVLNFCNENPNANLLDYIKSNL
ncbi:MAG: hypothetical protein Q7U04_11405 [Bacteriovorax sp.]|nr:hypothetical protein [Bacteriovorax sp.]